MVSDNIKTAGPKLVPISDIAPEVLQKGGSISFIATGNSMWPHIRHGDGVSVIPLDGTAAPGTGWVVVYLSSRKRLVVHRVIGNAGGGAFLVRGDASTGEPELVPGSSVLGRVVSRERRGRRVDLTTGPRSLEGRLIALGGSPRVRLERFLRRISRRLKAV